MENVWSLDTICNTMNYPSNSSDESYYATNDYSSIENCKKINNRSDPSGIPYKSEFDLTYDKMNVELARPYFNTPLYDYNKPPVKIQPTIANYTELINNTMRDTNQIIGNLNNKSTRSGATGLKTPLGCIGKCDDEVNKVKIREDAETQRAAINANANAQISIAKSNEEIARAKFERDRNLADNHRQEAEALYNAQVAVAKSQEEVAKAKFERDEAISEDNLRAQLAANETARAVSADKAQVAIAQEETTKEIARQAANVATTTLNLAAAVDQAKISQAGETDRTKLLIAGNVELTNINNVETTKRLAIEASARNYAVQQQTAVLVAQADASAKSQAVAINAASATSNIIAKTNADVLKQISRDNMMTQDATAKNVGVAVANSLGVTLGPNGIEGILGTVNDITNNKDAQFNRILTEQARQQTIQQQMQIAKEMNTTNAILQAQQQERLIRLQEMEQESERTVKMIKQLQGDTGALPNALAPPPMTASQTLSNLISNIVINAITKCQSNVEMEQEIGGSAGKITISGSKNVSFKPKQILSFSANCMQDSNSVSTMNNQISEQIKDFMSIQSKTVLDSMQETPQSINSTINNQVNNTFNSSTITEIITNFKLDQKIGNIDIKDSSDIDFSPEQTTQILLQATQKVVNKMDIVTGLELASDKTLKTDTSYTATDAQNTYKVYGFIILIILIILLITFKNDISKILNYNTGGIGSTVGSSNKVGNTV